jgi:hypothetical protein
LKKFYGNERIYSLCHWRLACEYPKDMKIDDYVSLAHFYVWNCWLVKYGIQGRPLSSSLIFKAKLEVKLPLCLSSIMPWRHTISMKEELHTFETMAWCKNEWPTSYYSQFVPPRKEPLASMGYLHVKRTVWKLQVRIDGREELM